MSDNKNNSYALSIGKKAHKALSFQADFMEEQTKKHLQKAQIKPNSFILEVGCGTGVNLKLLSKHAQNGHVLAMDINSEQLEVAKKTAEKLANITFMQGDVMDFSLPNPVDVMYGRLVLMHLTNPKMALRNMFNNLKPGGTLLLQESIWGTIHTEPKNDSAEQFVDLTIALGKSKNIDYNIGFKLKDLCSECGFESVENYFRSYKLPTSKAKDLFTDRTLELSNALIKENLISPEKIKKICDDIANLPEDSFIFPATQSHIIAKKPI